MHHAASIGHASSSSSSRLGAGKSVKRLGFYVSFYSLRTLSLPERRCARVSPVLSSTPFIFHGAYTRGIRNCFKNQRLSRLLYICYMKILSRVFQPVVPRVARLCLSLSLVFSARQYRANRSKLISNYPLDAGIGIYI